MPHHLVWVEKPTPHYLTPPHPTSPHLPYLQAGGVSQPVFDKLEQLCGALAAGDARTALEAAPPEPSRVAPPAMLTCSVAPMVAGARPPDDD